MKTISAFFVLAFFLFSCGSEEESTAVVTDSMSAKDSLKRMISEELAPPTELKQFNWFYSTFFHAVTTDNDSMFNRFIHPENGLWIIQSNGAVPQFVKVKLVSDFKFPNGKRLLPIARDEMVTEPKEEELPVVDCDKKERYNKSGCFTSERNVFNEEKIWQYAGLTPDQDKQVAKAASTISRVVINTANYKYYFSLINGSWYISFIDVRKPCEA